MQSRMEEDTGRVDEIYATPVSIETEPLLTHSSIHFNFRLGRETQRTTNCTELVLMVFKFCFCSLGFWGYRAWTYIPRFLLATLCIYQVFYVLYLEVWNDCSGGNATNISVNGTKTLPDVSFWTSKHIEEIDILVFSMASVFSCFVFIGCFIAAKRKETAFVSPSRSLMEDVESKDIFLLLVILVIMTLLASSSEVLNNVYGITTSAQENQLSSCNLFTVTGGAAQFLLYLVSFVICHNFAISSLTLGKLFLLLTKIH